MRGAVVEYKCEDGSIITIGGSFDAQHIFVVKKKIENRRRIKIVGHTARWKV